MFGRARNVDDIELPAVSDVTPAPPSIAGQVLTYQQKEQARTLIVGTSAWYTWLQTATVFTFTGDKGTFIARRERAGNKRGGWYWRAYDTHAGKRRRVYLGTPGEITPERLHAVAARLAGHDEDVEHVRARTRDRYIPANDARLSEDPARLPADLSWRRAERSALPGGVNRSFAVLPSPLTSLVGREHEVTAICTLLARAGVREVTITGTGGVGKTRLALEVAARIQQSFPDGICYVSLAALRDADLVLPAIAQAEGLPGNSTLSALELLQALLREKHHVLVLDNFEQVTGAAPRLVNLLSGCPRLKILVTSREVLWVRGEHEFVVQPLTLPDPKHLHYDDTLAHYGAMALFMERARVAQPALELTAHTAPLIMEICRRLDGLPLAIELAAARLKVLSLQALLERLGHRLQVLTGGPRDLPARQQTMGQTIAWSCGLLSAEEQRLFRLLSVFLNGCTLDAAEAVYSMMGGERTQALDAVTSLLDKHLLYTGGSNDHALRLLMHETIREYGLEALIANQELEAARQAHADYYLAQAHSFLESAKQFVLLEQLEWESANLRAALEWALERPASEVAARLESTLMTFLQRQQRLGEGQTVAEGSASSRQAAPIQALEGPLLTPEAVALEPDGRGRGTASAREPVGAQRGPEAARHFAVSFYLLSLVAWIIADFAAARMYAEEGSARARAAGEMVTLAYLIDLMGQIALDEGEDSRAQALLEEGLALHQQADDALGSLNALFFLQRALLAQGKATQAQARAEEHLALSKAIGFQSGVVGALTFLGRLALEAGNAAAAHALFEESLPLLREMNENVTLAVATNLQGIGLTLAKQGRLTDAVRLWSAAEALCPVLPEERALVARSLAAVRAALGEEAFAATWATGRGMTLEQALAEVGRVVPSPDASPARATRSGGRTRQHQRLSHDLTEREVEVLRLVARGLTDAQVADTLVISRRTVNAHLRSIYAKLNMSSRNAATYFALEHNLL